MYTFQQFLQRHPARYGKLSPAEKRKRYDDYVRTASASNGGSQRPAASRPARRRRQRNQAPFTSDPALLRYAQLYAAPFDTRAVGLPVFPTPPSTKVTGWSKGVVSIGTGGFGFISGLPTAANDANTVFYSGPTYAGSSVTTTGTGVFYGVLNNLPLSTSSFSDLGAYRVRISMYALRIRYIGTEQNKGGIIYGYVHPQHQSVNNWTVTTMSNTEDSTSHPVSRDWLTLRWTPAYRNECEYYHTNTPPQHANLEAATPDTPMAFILSGTPGNTFEYQAVCHMELIGTGVPGLNRTDNQASVTLGDRVDKLTNSNVGPAPEGAMSVQSVLNLLSPVARQGIITGVAASAVWAASRR